jgi:hypothetical protein
MELNDPVNIMKIIISLTEIAIEKTIYITKSSSKETEFSLPLLIKILKNDVYNFCTSDDILSEASQYISEVTIEYETDTEKTKTDSSEKTSEESDISLNSEDKKLLKYIKMNNDDRLWDEEYEGSEGWSDEDRDEYYEDEEYEDEEEYYEDGEYEDEENAYELTFDIPVYEIADQIEENYNEEEMRKYGLVGQIVGEINLIDNIWEEWSPNNHIGKALKNMVSGFEVDWLK